MQHSNELKLSKKIANVDNDYSHYDNFSSPSILLPNLI